MAIGESTIKTQSGDVFRFEGGAAETPGEAGNYRLLTEESHGISVAVQGSITTLMEAARILSTIKDQSQAEQVAALNAISGVRAEVIKQVDDVQLPPQGPHPHRRVQSPERDELSAQL